MIELSCCKYPLEDSLPVEWQKNKKSLVKYLQSVHMGIKGMVWDVNNNPVANAKIRVEGNDKFVTTTERGEYWRLLLPGSYRIHAESPNGFESVHQYVTVNADSVLRVDLKADQKSNSVPPTTPSSAAIDITTTATTSSATTLVNEQQGPITQLICLYGPAVICSAVGSIVKYFWN